MVVVGVVVVVVVLVVLVVVVVVVVVVVAVLFTKILIRKPFLASEPSLAKRAFKVKGAG